MVLFSHKKNIFMFFVSLLYLMSLQTQNTLNADETDYFKEIQRRLVEDGFSKEFIHTVYGKKKVEFDEKGISLFFMHNESKLNYNQFLSDENISKIKSYMRKHDKALQRVQKESGVDPRVITAIMLVETRLGTQVGSRGVLNTLSTMATMSEEDKRKIIWRSIPEEKRLSTVKFENKADMRSKWAYKELKAFLNYVKSEKLDPFKIKGSYAGAMGISQFTPSNILLLGKDGNKDGRIDLFNHDDAIFSIANYLKHHGWRPGIERNKAKKVVYHYNHSSYYVDTIMKITDLLERKKKNG